jgi:hypothetical protein
MSLILSPATLLLEYFRFDEVLRVRYRVRQRIAPVLPATGGVDEAPPWLTTSSDSGSAMSGMRR